MSEQIDVKISQCGKISKRQIEHFCIQSFFLPKTDSFLTKAIHSRLEYIFMTKLL